MAQRQASVRRAKRQMARGMGGFIVTWDVDSRDARACNQLKRFVFGQTVRVNGRTYRYPGFVEREGVRYLGQSVLFVVPDQLDEVLSLLRRHGIDHVVSEAALGPVRKRELSSDRPSDLPRASIG